MMSNSKFKITIKLKKDKIPSRGRKPTSFKVSGNNGLEKNDFFRRVFARKRLEHIQFTRGAPNATRHRTKWQTKGQLSMISRLIREQSDRDYDKSMPSILAAAVENYFNNSPKPYLETIPIVQFKHSKKGCDHLLILLTFWNYPFPN